jgi:protein-disulfide isomerase
VLAGPLRKRFEDQGVTITAKTPDQFAAHVKAEIAKPEYAEILGQLRQIGTQLNIQGTPSFIIGDEIVPHALDYPGLEEKVSKLR